MAIEETRQKLAEYGKWAMADKSIGYPRRSIIANPGAPDPKISDDEAMMIDRCLCELKKRHELESKALFYIYVRCQYVSDVATRLGLSRNSAIKVIERGEYWVDCAMSSF